MNLKHTAVEVIELEHALPGFHTEDCLGTGTWLAELDGDHFDNVMGVLRSSEKHPQEYVLKCYPASSEDEQTILLNLKDLLRLAKLGAEALLADEEPAPDPRTHKTNFDKVP